MMAIACRHPPPHVEGNIGHLPPQGKSTSRSTPFQPPLMPVDSDSYEAIDPAL
jgi:hypothetical protein